MGYAHLLLTMPKVLGPDCAFVCPRLRVPAPPQPFYTCPQILARGNMTKAADVYSFGVMMWEIYHR